MSSKNKLCIKVGWPILMCGKSTDKLRLSDAPSKDGIGRVPWTLPCNPRG